MTPANTETMIRPARVEDADTIARLHVDGWRETYAGIIPQNVLDGLDVTEKSKMWTKALASPDLDAFVGGAGESALTGFACARERTNVPETFDGEFQAIYVLKAGQGIGLGRGLMAEMARALATRGFRSAALRVARQNAPARAFYAHLGGVEAGEGVHQIGTISIDEVIFGWSDISVLL